MYGGGCVTVVTGNVTAPTSQIKELKLRLALRHCSYVVAGDGNKTQNSEMCNVVAVVVFDVCGHYIHFLLGKISEST